MGVSRGHGPGGGGPAGVWAHTHRSRFDNGQPCLDSAPPCGASFGDCHRSHAEGAGDAPADRNPSADDHGQDHGHRADTEGARLVMARRLQHGGPGRNHPDRLHGQLHDRHRGDHRREDDQLPDGVLIQAAGVTIKNSKVNGRIVVDTDVNRSWSLTLQDSEVNAGAGDLPAIYNGNVTIVRANIHGGHNGLECQEHSSVCSMRDSWVHAQWQAASGDTHLGGVLALGSVVRCTGLNGACIALVHNRIVCDAPVNPSGGGCTGDINLLPHYGPLPGAIIQNNYLGANTGASFCTYGGAGMEHPASGIVYTGNVFQRGSNRVCAAYGPVTNFDTNAPGNVWSDNRYDDGTTVLPDN